MGGKYVDDFSFPKDFGFSGSSAGRHDPKPQARRSDNEFGDGMAKGGHVKMAKGGKVQRKADGGAADAPVYPPEALPGAPQVKPRAQVVPAASRDYQQGVLHGARLGAKMATQHVLGSAMQARQQQQRPAGPPPMQQSTVAPAAPGAVGALKQGGHITAAQRHALPKSEFALSGERYPIDTPGRARSALSRASANASPAEKSKIRSAVHRKYPKIGKE